MSNRKYAAGLLEGGTHTEKERLESVMVFVRLFVQESIQKFLDSPKGIEDEDTKDIFKNIGQGKLMELAPDLAEKYDVIVGLSETSAGVFIGCREKPRRYGWANGSLIGEGFTSNGGADIARIINESASMDGSVVRDLRATSIRAGEIVFDAFNRDRYIQADTIQADRILPFTVRERFGPGYIVDPRAMAQVNLDLDGSHRTTEQFSLDGLARRTSAPAQLAEIGIVGGDE